jgi:hypothetical protein
MFLTSIAVLLARRPDQFRAPYLWAEEGVFILPQFVERGWAALFEPVSGYMIIPSKIVNFLSLTLSFNYYPEFNAAFSVLVSALVVCAVALSPTHLPQRWLCALCVLFVPSDPEIYAIGLLVFWWSSLLLFLALLWREDAGYKWLRAAYVVVGCLSSPLAVLLTPLFVLQYALNRRWRDALVPGLCVLLSAMQVWLVLQTKTHTVLPFAPRSILHGVLKYLGYFVWSNWLPWKTVDLVVSIALGVALAGFLAWRIRQERSKLNLQFSFLVSVFFISVLVNSLRVLPEVVHPFHAGPRYFFFPWIALSWIIVWLASVSSRGMRRALLLILALSLLNGARGFARFHTPIDWREQVAACRASSAPYVFPIHTDGDLKHLWRVTLTPEQCERMFRQSVF